MSSTEQDLEAQRKAVMEAIKKDYFEDDEILLIEGKESAILLEEEERVTLNQLNMAISENSSIRDVYFFAIDRLARKVSIVLSVVDKMLKKGINLHFLNPYPMQTMRNGKEDATGKMFLTFLSIGAEMEMKMKGERFKATREQMREKEQILNGKVYYGYYRDKDGYPQKDEEQANVVLDIFNMYVHKDMTIAQIGRELQLQGKMTGYFRSSLVTKIANILKNPLYSEGKGRYKAIVPQDLQQRAIAKINDRKRPKKEGNYTYLCRGLVYYSGGDLYKLMSPSLGDGSYQVDTEFTNLPTKQYNVSIDVVDYVAWREVKKLYVMYQKHYMFFHKDELQEDIKAQETRISKIEEEIRNWKEKKSKALKKAIFGDMEEADINDIREKFDIILKPLENDLIKARNTIQTNKDIIDSMREKNKEYDPSQLGNLEKHQMQKIVRDMVGEVMVRPTGNKEVEITVQPSELFKFSVVIPKYTYIYRGGRKKLFQGEENLTSEIPREYPTRKK